MRSTVPSLYKATEEADRAFQAVNLWIEENEEALTLADGVIPDSINEEYDAAMKQIDKAVEHEAKRILSLRAEAREISNEVKRLQRRMVTVENHAETRERMLEEHFLREHKNHYHTALVDVKMQENPPKVIAPQWSQVELGQFWASPEYDWMVNRAEATFALDKNAIKEAAKLGTKLPDGIKIVQETHIRIK